MLHRRNKNSCRVNGLKEIQAWSSQRICKKTNLIKEMLERRKTSYEWWNPLFKVMFERLEVNWERTTAGYPIIK